MTERSEDDNAYHNQQQKDNIWKEIAGELKRPGKLEEQEPSDTEGVPEEEMKVEAKVETITCPDDGDDLVRVRAQVMSRDNSSGGWVPFGGGGLSDVSIRRCARSEGSGVRYDYLILGKMFGDDSVVLSCYIKRDFQYHKVMPTFHHWQTGCSRFGLTFQAAADGRAFDKGVRMAVEDLLAGLSGTTPLSRPKCSHEGDEDEDEVFMTLNLPQDPRGSGSSDSNSNGRSRGTDHSRLPGITYVGREQPESSRQPVPVHPQKGASEYVQLQPRHEYFYVENPLTQQPSRAPIWESQVGMKQASPPQPPQPLAVFNPVNKRPQHHICRHCNEPFTREQNKRGSCRYSRDTVKTVFNGMSCFPVISCFMYHCTADSEGDFQEDPFRCLGDDETRGECACRWAGLCGMTFCFPCIWLYPLLKCCHRKGAKWGIWGGRHSATANRA